MKKTKKNSKKYDSKKYDSMIRFLSYFYQIDIIRDINPDTILEIGIGNKTTANYLKNNGFNVTTCDIDEDLCPDYTADIRKLPFKDKTYDLIAAFEIIEHIPWDDVHKALSEIHRVSKKYAIISIPYSSADFEIIITFPFIKRILNRRFLDIFFRIPFLKRKGKLWSSNHHWEMGRKGYPPKKIRRNLEQYFKIVEEIRPVLVSGHHFFVLEKKRLKNFNQQKR